MLSSLGRVSDKLILLFQVWQSL